MKWPVKIHQSRMLSPAMARCYERLLQLKGEIAPMKVAGIIGRMDSCNRKNLSNKGVRTMKKIIVAMCVTVSMLVSISTAAFANLYSVEAENGKILRPTGISIDGSGIFTSGGDFTSDHYRAEVGYGAFSSITVSGAYEKEGDVERLLAKAYVSPVHDEEGYTLYAGYDLKAGELAMVGASVWMDYKYFFGFVNVESDVDRSGERSLSVTPGINLRLTSKLRVLGEAELDAEDMDVAELRAGVQYNFADKLAGKVVVIEEKDLQDDTVFQAGLSMEI